MDRDARSSKPLTAAGLRKSFGRTLLLAGVWTLFSAWRGYGFFWQVIPPIIAMLAYLYSFTNASGKTAFQDMFANSMYYLGFALTVVSLFASLIPYTAEGATISGTDLLGKFGIALSTTLLGLILRTYYSAFPTNPDTMQQEVKESIRASAKLLQDEMAYAARSFEEFNSRFKNRLDELERCIEDNVSATFTKSTEQTRALIDNVHGEMTGAVEASARDLKIAMAAIVGSVDAAMVDLTDKLRGIDIDADLVNGIVRGAFSGITDEFRNVADAVGASRDELTTAVSRMSGSLTASASELGNAIDGLSAGVRSIDIDPGIIRDSVRDGFSGVGDAFDKTADEVLLAGGTLRQTVSALSDAARDVERLCDGFRSMSSAAGDMELFANNLTDTERALTKLTTLFSETAETVRTVRGDYAELSTAVASQKNAATDMQSGMRAAQEELAELRNNLNLYNKDLNSGAQQFGVMQASLNQEMDTLIRSLGKNLHTVTTTLTEIFDAFSKLMTGDRPRAN